MEAAVTGDGARNTAPPGQKVARPWFTLVALALAAATAIIAQTLVLPVLGEIATEFGVSPTDAIWVLTVNLIAATVFSPVIGRLGDAYGRKRVMLVALAAVLAGSLLAAVASTFWLVLVGRVLQGTAFGVIALAISIVRDTFPPQKVSLGIALLSAIMGIGGGAGMVLSGLLAEVGSFELIFWTAAGASALGLALITATVPESHGGGDRHLDIPGAVLLALWLSGLLLAVDRGADWGWGDGRIIGMLAGSVVLLATWVAVELRVRVPLVDMKVFVKPVVLGTNITGLLIGLGMFGAFTLINQFVATPPQVGYGFGADALETGLTLLPMTLGVLIAAPLATVLINKTGPKLPLSVGGVVAGLAFGALALWNSEQWYFLVALAVIGIGVGLSMSAMPQMLNYGVPHSQTGIANGMNSTLRELGSSTGSAMAAAILSAQVIDNTEIPTLDSYEFAFVISGVLALVAAAAAAMIPQRKAMAELAAQEHDEITASGQEAVGVRVVEHAEPAMAMAGAPAEMSANGNGHAELAPTVVGAGRNGMAQHDGPGDLQRTPGTSQARTEMSAAAARGPARSPSSAAGTWGSSDRAGVYGAVVTPRGTGLSGVALTLTDASGQQVGRSTSGGEGQFRLEPLQPGTYVLIASGPGHQPHASQVLVGHAPTPLTITLAGAASLTGTITSSGHWPLAGARVILTNSAGEVTHTATTGQDGSYTLAALVADSYTLVVSEHAHQPVAEPVEIPDTGQVQRDIMLPTAATLVGTIRAAATGEGLHDARISLLDVAGNHVAATETDPHGHYLLTGLSAGEYTVVTTGYPPVSDTVHINGDGTAEYDVDLGHSPS